MKRAIFVGLVVCLCAAWALAGETQVAVSYVYQGSNPVPTQGWFRMSGGRGEVSRQLNGRWSVVGEVGGAHTGAYGLSRSPLSQITFMGGPRLALLSRKAVEKATFVPFVQFLAGGAYAADGLFPQGAIIKHSARSVAMSAGGGLDIPMRRNLSLRLIQADYLYTHLPDGYDDVQNSYRVGVGVIWHWR